MRDPRTTRSSRSGRSARFGAEDRSGPGRLKDRSSRSGRSTRPGAEDRSDRGSLKDPLSRAGPRTAAEARSGRGPPVGRSSRAGRSRRSGAEVRPGRDPPAGRSSRLGRSPCPVPCVGVRAAWSSGRRGRPAPEPVPLPPRAGTDEPRAAGPPALRRGAELVPEPPAARSAPGRRSTSGRADPECSAAPRGAGRSGVQAPREARAVAASRISQPRWGRSPGEAPTGLPPAARPLVAVSRRPGTGPPPRPSRGPPPGRPSRPLAAAVLSRGPAVSAEGPAARFTAGRTALPGAPLPLPDVPARPPRGVGGCSAPPRLLGRPVRSGP